MIDDVAQTGNVITLFWAVALEEEKYLCTDQSHSAAWGLFPLEAFSAGED